MKVAKSSSSDSTVDAVQGALKPYQASHAKARIEIKRQNLLSVRIRIIDPDFNGLDRVEREAEIWKLLDKLPAKVRENITFLLLLTPKEQPQSDASYEFDHPRQSLLL